jgi:hypothetical protein
LLALAVAVALAVIVLYYALHSKWDTFCPLASFPPLLFPLYINIYRYNKTFPVIILFPAFAFFAVAVYCPAFADCFSDCRFFPLFILLACISLLVVVFLLFTIEDYSFAVAFCFSV